MNDKIVIGKRGKTSHSEHLKEKTCAFPDCTETFFSTACSRYCPEHRKKEYRKQIEASGCTRKSKNTMLRKTIENSNQTITHTFFENHTISVKCGLDGCSNQFNIELIAGNNVYPKYCSEHTNQYKRELFIKRQTNI